MRWIIFFVILVMNGKVLAGSQSGKVTDTGPEMVLYISILVGFMTIHLVARNFRTG